MKDFQCPFQSQFQTFLYISHCLISSCIISVQQDKCVPGNGAQTLATYYQFLNVTQQVQGVHSGPRSPKFLTSGGSALPIRQAHHHLLSNLINMIAIFYSYIVGVWTMNNDNMLSFFVIKQKQFKPNLLIDIKNLSQLSNRHFSWVLPQQKGQGDVHVYTHTPSGFSV